LVVLSHANGKEHENWQLSPNSQPKLKVLDSKYTFWTMLFPMGFILIFFLLLRSSHMRASNA
jgi:hypothetical protein